jgi:hypothetical protein
MNRKLAAAALKLFLSFNGISRELIFGVVRFSEECKLHRGVAATHLRSNNNPQSFVVVRMGSET